MTKKKYTCVLIKMKWVLYKSELDDEKKNQVFSLEWNESFTKVIFNDAVDQLERKNVTVVLMIFLKTF